MAAGRSGWVQQLDAGCFNNKIIIPCTIEYKYKVFKTNNYRIRLHVISFLSIA